MAAVAVAENNASPQTAIQTHNQHFYSKLITVLQYDQSVNASMIIISLEI